MKKRRLLLTSMLLIAIAVCTMGAASASEMAVDLPQGVKTLIEQTYPTHLLEGTWGHGDEQEGTFVLSLSLRVEEWKEFILCIVNKSQGDSAYAFTIDGGSTMQIERAPTEVELSQSELVITIRTDYNDDMPVTDRYVLHKNAHGAWTLISGTNTEVLIYDVDGTQVREQIVMELSIKDGMLAYVRTIEGEQRHYAPVPFGESFERYFLLSNFDGAFPLTPFAFDNSKMSKLIDTPLVAEGEELKQADLQVDELILVVKLADGLEQIRFCTWDEAAKTFHVENCKPTAIDITFDTLHFYDGDLGLHQYTEINGESYHCFVRTPQGKWRLSEIQGLEKDISLGSNYAAEIYGVYWWRNDRYWYGEHPWQDILLMDFDALPTSADITAQLDQSNYALVSNPTPDTRLNIRTDPTSEAMSLGKLYSRTPVYVKEIMGDWVHVSVGSAEGMDGYVMKKFLAFGDDKEAVKCAFPGKILKTQIKEHAIFAEPNGDADIVGWTSAYEHFIIGVYGDDWYIVLTRDGVVGYMPRDWYCEGNG
ncbi:MAG: SH3 domain-containing protein [Clostridiales bacterium]|nr:SH3 domain-containing protein [Clostridiales bacterium]